MKRNDIEDVIYRAAETLDRNKLMDKERMALFENRLADLEIRTRKDDRGIRCNQIRLLYPQYIDDQWKDSRIILCLTQINHNKLFISQLVHETIHIASISSLLYESSEESRHWWGICKTDYRVESGRITANVDRELEFLNEYLTNLVAEKLYVQIFGNRFYSESYVNPVMALCNKENKNTTMEIIKAYLHNRRDAVKSELGRMTGCVELRDIQRYCRNYLQIIKKQ